MNIEQLKALTAVMEGFTVLQSGTLDDLDMRIDGVNVLVEDESVGRIHYALSEGFYFVGEAGA